jgi:hypothetical protein
VAAPALLEVPAGGASAGGVAAGGAESLEEAAGGVVSAAGAGVVDSCFEQAASASAATRALRASLVFIERYPEEEFGNGERETQGQTN